MRTTVGQMLINDALPENMRDYSRVLDKSGIGTLMSQVASEHPEKYAGTLKTLSDVGRHVAYTTGGNSVGLEDIGPSPRAEALKIRLKQQTNAILANRALSPKERRAALIDAARNTQGEMVNAVFTDSREENNPLAEQLVGAGRGDKHALNRLRGSDLLYADGQGKPIPIPVFNSYSQGLSPAEYFAASYGARSGVLATKRATADAGYTAKQLLQAAHRLVVSANDSDGEADDTRGLPVEVDDSENEGALLARPIGPYRRNTILTPRILKHLKTLGHEKLLVRSPIVGGPADGGVYANDVGVREKQRIAAIGEFSGVSASQSLSEPITQLQLKSKHQGGVVGNQKVTGFGALNAMLQVPEVFPGGATHAERDGTVTHIEPAPQGGTYVYVDGHQHYVPSDQNVTVKPNDTIEAGDTLSDGLPNPEKITEHKGIGEGRAYFTKTFKDILKNSGSYGHRRNVELVARGLINHVRLTDELGDWAPGDVLPYHLVEHNYQPRPGALSTHPQAALGHFLEKPVLHYTIGTRMTPSVVKSLQDFNIPQVTVHKDPPPFKAEMIRAMENVNHDPDVFTRFLGGYQERGLLRGVHRGGISDTNSTSFVPALMEGTTFGKAGPTKGWNSSVLP